MCLVDAVGGGHGVVVVTESEVADALLVWGEQGALGALLAAQAGGTVCFVGDEDLEGDAGLSYGVGDDATKGLFWCARTRAMFDIALRLVQFHAYAMTVYSR